MKSGLYKFLTTSLIALTSITFGQNPEWINYTHSDVIFSTVEDENFYWSASMGGLSKISKNNGEVFTYTKANSDLPDNFIFCMTQDSFGNKWLGTYNEGLVKFDGINFITFNTQNSILPGDKINAITVDHQHNVWAGTDSGLVKYDGVNWTLYDFQNFNYDWIDVNALFVDASGDLWVSTQELLRFNGTIWTEYLNQIWPIYSIDQAPDGTIWFGGNSLKKFDGLNWTSVTGYPNDYIMSLAVDSNNILWVGTNFAGLASYNGNNWTVYDTSNTPFKVHWILHVFVNDNNEKVIGTQKGLYKFNDVNWTEINSSSNGLASWVTWSMMIAPDGKKWFAGNTGISCFDDSIWTTFSYFDDPSLFYEITSITADISGNIWAGRRYGGLLKFDGNIWTEVPVSIGGINCLKLDNQNNLWIGTSGGLAKFDGLQWTYYQTSNSGLPNNRVASIEIDSDGRKWIGTQQGGLAVFNDTTWIVYNATNSALLSNYITSIAFDLDGKVWAGTYGGGLAEFDGDNWVIYHTGNSILPVNEISAIAIDSDNNKWISCNNEEYYYSNGGVVKFDGNQWTLFDSDNSPMPTNTVTSIAIDRFNNKWFTYGFGGVTVFNESGITLPVELIFFSAEVVKNKVNLKWFTASELNNRGFEVERRKVLSQQSSVSNLEWNTIGFVEGNGTQSQTHNYNFIDSTVTSGKHSYRLKQIDYDGSFTYSNIVEIDLTPPNTFSLSQNYPNPFNPSTTIRYTVASNVNGQMSKVLMKVFDILGREVAMLVNEEKPAGSYEIKFNASHLASGVYFYSLNAGEFKMTKKMLLLR